MKKSHFSNKTFYWIIIAIVGNMLIYNLYSTLTTGRLIGLLPIIIQVIVIGLILTKHQYVKKGIEVWAVISFIIPYLMMFIGRLLIDISDNFVNVDSFHYIWTGFLILMGIVIIVYANRTVQVLEIEK